MVIPDNIQAVGSSIIVRRIPVNTPSEVKTQGGIIIKQEEGNDHNGFALGLVLSVGDKVTQVKKGDYLIFRSQVTLALPNGIKSPVLYRMSETDTQIVGLVKDDDIFGAAQASQGIQ